MMCFLFSFSRIGQLCSIFLFVIVMDCAYMKDIILQFAFFSQTVNLLRCYAFQCCNSITFSSNSSLICPIAALNITN